VVHLVQADQDLARSSIHEVGERRGVVRPQECLERRTDAVLRRGHGHESDALLLRQAVDAHPGPPVDLAQDRNVGGLHGDADVTGGSGERLPQADRGVRHRLPSGQRGGDVGDPSPIHANGHQAPAAAGSPS
jgi:hypothetical protein